MQEEHTKHLVIPGQVIVSSTSNDGGNDGFLRGHGTYIEGGGHPLHTENVNGERDVSHGDTLEDDSYRNNTDADADSNHAQNQRLIASVSGTIERVNKLITIRPFALMPYQGQVGDLVVGRITAVHHPSRWKVYLGSACREAVLPLSGVNLPGGVQRIRTAQDALGMRQLFVEGDLLSAEVQSVDNHGGIVMLHTRSLRYGKLENGCLVVVPSRLIVKRKQHFVTLPISSIVSKNSINHEEDMPNVDMILGTNGFIWIQRSTPKSWTDAYQDKEEDGGASVVPLAETYQKLKKRHLETPVMPEERENIARVRNSIEALKLISCRITPETVMDVFKASVEAGLSVKDMLKPSVVLLITKSTRRE